jgi:hypothetical protein
MVRRFLQGQPLSRRQPDAEIVTQQFQARPFMSPPELHLKRCYQPAVLFAKEGWENFKSDFLGSGLRHAAPS